MQTVTPQFCLNQWLEHLEQQTALERREAPRYRIHGPVEITLAGEEGAAHRYRGWAQELSRHGMGWLMIEPLAIDTRVMVDATCLGAGQLVLPIGVVYCQMVLEGIFRLGGMLLLDDQASHPVAG